MRSRPFGGAAEWSLALVNSRIDWAWNGATSLRLDRCRLPFLRAPRGGRPLPIVQIGLGDQIDLRQHGKDLRLQFRRYADRQLVGELLQRTIGDVARVAPLGCELQPHR